ncbi:Endoglucanase E1 [Cytospora mali]|uniref:Endoglucanase E1 n=1 Tax=Cytospora mali TaxID=578113 RepID=A0A194VMT9_CYTMA|nr:Endoglucanase E1 [Valsa mali]
MARLITLLLLLALTALTTPVLSTTTPTPPALPLSTSSRWILDAESNRVKLRCANWAGHMEAHLPEGLHKQPIGYLAGWLADQGFNCVRLTYSIDWALNPTLSVSDAFAQAATAANVPAADMADIYAQALVQNPFLANATTRDVYGEVIAQLWSRGVMTILDNHVSKASWCCNLTDGNGWWDTAAGYNEYNSRYFNTTLWLEGLQSVAAWATTQTGVVGMSLRNEIRQFLLQGLNGPYSDWYDLVSQAAQAVHAANPDVLVVVGGVSSATDLSTVRTRALDRSAWAGKHVWEFHAYSFTVTFALDLGSCDVRKEEYGAFDGFLLTQGENYTAPLFLSEFGVDMTGGDYDGLSEGDSEYLSCLVGYMSGNDAEWAVWALQGSYYVRNGKVDYNETWGLLDSSWSTWRNAQFPGLLGAMWNVSQGP